ncbi:MAG: FtsX-like permease family protein [Polyangiales bacterium]
MFALLREISFRHWMRARLRSLLIVLGIALGVGLYVATEAATDSLLGAFQDLVQRIAGRADLCIQGTGLGVPAELVGKVAELPGVEHTASSLEVTAHAPDYDESLLVLGVDLLGDMHFLPFDVQSGERSAIVDPLSFVNDPRALLLSQRFAERHGLREGSELTLLTADGTKAFHVRGVLADSGAAASFGGQVAVMFQDAAQVSFARGTYVDRIDVALSPGASLDDVQQTIKRAVGESFSVDRPEQVGGRLRSLAAPLEVGLAITGFLAILVGSFLVYNAVAIAVAQRRHEVGTLRALGETRAGVVSLFMLEAAILALPGSAIGILVGRALSRISVASTLQTLDSLFIAAPQLTPALAPNLIVRAFGAGLVMALVSAYFPARRGTAFDPALTLRGASNVEIERPSVRGMLIAALVVGSLAFLPLLDGSAVGGFAQLTIIVVSAALATPAFVVGMRALFVGVVELVFGVPGRLGLDYVERTLGRSTINVLALMVAVGMSISVSSWLGSFERSLVKWAGQVGTADLTITRGSPLLDRHHVPLRSDAVERVRAVPGVQDLQRFRMVDEQLGDVTLRLVATDTDVFIEQGRARGKGWEVVGGRPLRAGDVSTDPSIVLSENAARLLHVSAGDTLALPTPNQGQITVRVRAVVVDFTSETGTGFIDLRVFHKHWADEVVDGLCVYLAPGSTTDVVADRLREALGRDGSIFVSKTASVEQHILDTLRRVFSYSRAVEVMTLIIGLLGVIGTMIAAVLDRQREISMLRAIGATRRQVALSIVIEAGFLGFCAATAGILVGVVETQVFFRTLVATETGWHLSFVFPWASALRTTGLVVLTSALAGAIPAYRALHRELMKVAVAE